MALGSTQPLTEMNNRSISWGLRRPVRKAENLTTILCPLSCNLGTLTSWNALGHSRPVTGLLYLYLYLYVTFVWEINHNYRYVVYKNNNYKPTITTVWSEILMYQLTNSTTPKYVPKLLIPHEGK
jgi:hypothetical protein